MSEKPNSTEELSLEDIDKFLEEDDPEFAMSLSDITKEELGSDEEIEVLNLDESEIISDEVQAEDQNVVKSTKNKFIQKILNFKSWVASHFKKIFNPLTKIPKLINNGWSSFRLYSISFAKRAWVFVKNDFPQYLKYIISILIKTLNKILESIKFFFAKPKLEVIGWIVSSSLLIIGIILGVFNLKSHWLPSYSNDYILDLSKVGKVFDIDNDEMISFDEAFPQPNFTFLMDKIVLNLTASERHENPMLAFQFYVSLDSQETAVEMKNREIELMDYVQRAVEDLTYEDVHGVSGRSRLKLAIKNEVNKYLNQGRVIDVYIETFISKP